MCGVAVEHRMGCLQSLNRLARLLLNCCWAAVGVLLKCCGRTGWVGHASCCWHRLRGADRDFRRPRCGSVCVGTVEERVKRCWLAGRAELAGCGGSGSQEAR